MAAGHVRRTPANHVRCRSVALVRVDEDRVAPAVVDLVGGRHRHSVGGQIAEGSRWWTGRLEWLRDPVVVRPGTVLDLELEDGRRGEAIVEPVKRARTSEVTIVGLGPPPFDVDGCIRS